MMKLPLSESGATDGMRTGQKMEQKVGKVWLCLVTPQGQTSTESPTQR